MKEEDIVMQLRQGLPSTASDPAPPVAPAISTDEQSSFVTDAANELAMLKLGNALGVINPDEKTTQYLRFIYETAAASAADTSYDSILAAVNDHLLRLGLIFNEDRLMKLYLWMKLNQERTAIEREMANVGR